MKKIIAIMGLTFSVYMQAAVTLQVVSEYGDDQLEISVPIGADEALCTFCLDHSEGVKVTCCYESETKHGISVRIQVFPVDAKVPVVEFSTFLAWNKKKSFKCIHEGVGAFLTVEVTKVIDQGVLAA